MRCYEKLVRHILLLSFFHCKLAKPFLNTIRNILNIKYKTITGASTVIVKTLNFLKYNSTISHNLKLIIRCVLKYKIGIFLIRNIEEDNYLNLWIWRNSQCYFCYWQSSRYNYRIRYKSSVTSFFHLYKLFILGTLTVINFKTRIYVHI